MGASTGDLVTVGGALCAPPVALATQPPWLRSLAPPPLAPPFLAPPLSRTPSPAFVPLAPSWFLHLCFLLLLNSSTRSPLLYYFDLNPVLLPIGPIFPHLVNSPPSHSHLPE